MRSAEEMSLKSMRDVIDPPALPTGAKTAASVVKGTAAPFPVRSASLRGIAGISLQELIIVILILGVLMSQAIPLYVRSLDKAEDASVVQDLRVLSEAITLFRNNEGRWPDDLAEINWTKKDPWGNDYVYLVLDDPGGPGNGRGGGAAPGQARKNRNLTPINTDYDLYSMGADGRSQAPLTASHSRDDIVRANNGRFFGVARDFAP